MTGDKLPAEQAERMGLIWQCVEDAMLMETAHGLAARLATMPTKALVETRRALDDAGGLDLDAALQREGELQRTLGRSHDYLEGAAAFLQKRSPTFKDR
jgi:2-(1,2-epoxy-1,2-dihydrophenyl)acetyl-CoA isomerase